MKGKWCRSRLSWERDECDECRASLGNHSPVDELVCKRGHRHVCPEGKFEREKEVQCSVLQSIENSAKSLDVLSTSDQATLATKPSWWLTLIRCWCLCDNIDVQRSLLYLNGLWRSVHWFERHLNSCWSSLTSMPDLNKYCLRLHAWQTCLHSNIFFWWFWSSENRLFRASSSPVTGDWFNSLLQMQGELYFYSTFYWIDIFFCKQVYCVHGSRTSPCNYSRSSQTCW